MSEEWLELDIIARTLGVSRARDVARLVRKLAVDGIIAPDEFRAGERVSVGAHGGRPRDLLFLSRSAVVAVAAHLRTPEAVAFRREALGRLVSTAPALPVVSADDTPEQVRELRARLDVLEARVAEGERRMLSAGAQFALPGVGAHSKRIQRGRYLSLSEKDAAVRAWAACCKAAKRRGLTTSEAAALAADAAAEVGFKLDTRGDRVAIGALLTALEGHVVDGVTVRGRPCKANQMRWFVESVEEGAVH